MCIIVYIYMNTLQLVSWPKVIELRNVSCVTLETVPKLAYIERPMSSQILCASLTRRWREGPERDLWPPPRRLQGRSGETRPSWWFCAGPCRDTSVDRSPGSSGRRTWTYGTAACRTSPSDLEKNTNTNKPKPQKHLRYWK